MDFRKRTAHAPPSRLEVGRTACFFQKIQIIIRIINQLLFTTDILSYRYSFFHRVYKKNLESYFKGHGRSINTKGSFTYRFYPQETSIVRLRVGRLAAVMFLHYTWENSLFLLKMFGHFGNSLERDKKSFLPKLIGQFLQFSQNLYRLYSYLGSDMRFCVQTTLCLL